VGLGLKGRRRRKGGCCLHHTIVSKFKLKEVVDWELRKVVRGKGVEGGMLTLDEVFALRTLLESFLKTIRYFLTLQLVSCCLKCPKSPSAYHPACLHLSSLLLRYWGWKRTAQHYYLAIYASRAIPLDPVGAADVSLTNFDGRGKARGRG